MTKLKILIWKTREPTGVPSAEVTIPAYLAKWIPRLNKFGLKKVLGEEVNLEDFNLDELIKEAIEKNESEILEVKTQEGYVKILLEK